MQALSLSGKTWIGLDIGNEEKIVFPYKIRNDIDWPRNKKTDYRTLFRTGKIKI